MATNTSEKHRRFIAGSLKDESGDYKGTECLPGVGCDLRP